MTDSIITFFQETFTNPWIVVLLISLLPLIELRGAIPVGVAMFMAQGLSVGVATLNSFVVAFIGSSIVCPLIYLFLEWGLNLVSKIKIFKNLIDKIRNKFNAKSEKLKKSIEDGTKDINDLEEHNKKVTKLQFWGLFTFVAIPLPLTGVYTGSAVGVFTDIKFKNALPAIILGNLTAGLIISVVSFAFGIVL